MTDGQGSCSPTRPPDSRFDGLVEPIRTHPDVWTLVEFMAYPGLKRTAASNRIAALVDEGRVQAGYFKRIRNRWVPAYVTVK